MNDVHICWFETNLLSSRAQGGQDPMRPRIFYLELSKPLCFHQLRSPRIILQLPPFPFSWQKHKWFPLVFLPSVLFAVKFGVEQQPEWRRVLSDRARTRSGRLPELPIDILTGCSRLRGQDLAQGPRWQRDGLSVPVLTRSCPPAQAEFPQVRGGRSGAAQSTPSQPCFSAFPLSDPGSAGRESRDR